MCTRTASEAARSALLVLRTGRLHVGAQLYFQRRSVHSRNQLLNGTLNKSRHAWGLHENHTLRRPACGYRDCSYTHFHAGPVPFYDMHLLEVPSNLTCVGDNLTSIPYAANRCAGDGTCRLFLYCKMLVARRLSFDRESVCVFVFFFVVGS